MQLSLRPQILAGTTAVVGAGAMALTALAPAAAVPALHQARVEVSLATYANPFTAVIGTLGVAGSYLLNGGMAFNPPTAGAGAINWPAAGISDVMNSYLQFEGLGGYTSVGILPQIVNDSFPIGTALVTNALDYIWNTVEAVGVAGTAIGDIVWTIPTTTVSVVVDLLTLNFAQALADVSSAVTSIVADISTAGNALLGAGTYVLTGVATRAVALVAAVVSQVPLTLIESVRQVVQIGSSVLETGQAIIASLATLDPETIWNTAVAGLLSPGGIPGTVLNATLGAGIQLGPVTTQESIAENFVFSTRTLVQGGVKAIAGAINTPNPAPPAAAATRAEVMAAAARTVADLPAPLTEAAPADPGTPTASNARASAVEPTTPVATTSVTTAADPEALNDGVPPVSPNSDQAPASGEGKAGAQKGGRS